jgi:hypothetical protein
VVGALRSPAAVASAASTAATAPRRASARAAVGATGCTGSIAATAPIRDARTEGPECSGITQVSDGTGRCHVADAAGIEHAAAIRAYDNASAAAHAAFCIAVLKSVEAGTAVIAAIPDHPVAGRRAAARIVVVGRIDPGIASVVIFAFARTGIRVRIGIRGDDDLAPRTRPGGTELSTVAADRRRAGGIIPNAVEAVLLAGGRAVAGGIAVFRTVVAFFGGVLGDAVAAAGRGIPHLVTFHRSGTVRLAYSLALGIGGSAAIRGHAAKAVCTAAGTASRGGISRVVVATRELACGIVAIRVHHRGGAALRSSSTCSARRLAGNA